MWLVDKATSKVAETLAPPAMVSGLTLLGVSLQDWVYILTIVYLLVMISKTLYTAVRDWWIGRKDG
ncbi:holin [Pectobacterium phage Arno160]|uniref:Holin n=1 Tax=Pectobacterium phage Arno160 TaxID=2488835 RepID=A0A3G8F1X5_9CAUD|nr:holin [Pectobacterium phage Arno160]AZF88105.1 holin [Pectobacterium phage Arno160]